MISVLNGFGRAPVYNEASPSDEGYTPGAGVYKPAPPLPATPPAQSSSAENVRATQTQPAKEIDFVKYGMIAGGVALVAVGIYAAYKYENKLKLDKVFNGHFSRTRRNKK